MYKMRNDARGPDKERKCITTYRTNNKGEDDKYDKKERGRHDRNKREKSTNNKESKKKEPRCLKQPHGKRPTLAIKW